MGVPSWVVLLTAYIVLAAVPSSAILQEAPSVNYFKQNNRMFQREFTPFTCDEGDVDVEHTFNIAEDVAAGVTAHEIKITCRQAKYNYELQNVGYVPAASNVVEMEVCLVADPAAYAGNDTEETPVIPGIFDGGEADSGVTGRRLMELAMHGEHTELVDAMYRFKESQYINIEHIHAMHKAFVAIPQNMRKLLFFPLDLVMLPFKLFKAVACAFPFMNCGSGKGSGDDLTEEKDAMMDAKRDLMEKLRERDAKLGEIEELRNKQSVIVGAQLNNTVQSLKAQQVAIRAETDARNLLANLTEKALRQQSADIEGIRGDLDATVTLIDDLAGTVNSQLDAVIAAMKKHVDDINDKLGNVTQATSDNDRFISKSLRDAVREVRELTGVVWDHYNNRQVRRDLTAMSTLIISAINGAGTDRAFLLNEGEPPLSPSDPEYSDWSKIRIDEISILYVDNTNSISPVLREERQSIFCDSILNLKQFAASTTWKDIIENIGPLDCTPDEDCRCWIERRERTCPFNTALLASDPIWERADFIDDDPSLCSGAIIPQAPVVDTCLTEYHDNFRDICVRPLRPTYDYKISSTQLLKSLDAPYDAQVCDVDLETVFSRADANQQENFIWDIYRILEQSALVAIARTSEFERRIFGLMPQGMTFGKRPFRASPEVPDGHSCYTAAMAVVSNAPYVSVNVLRLNSIESKVDIQIDGGSISTVDAVANIPFDFTLPTNQVLFGSPNDITFFNRVFDTPATENSLAPDGLARTAKTTFLITNDTARNTLQTWEEDNGKNFDPYGAANSINVYRRETTTNIDGSVLCLGTTLTDGEFCTRLEQFRFYSPGGNLVRYEPVAYTQSFTVELPPGPLTAVIYSECPSISLGANTGTTQVITLTNTNQIPIKTGYEIIGDCPEPLKELTVGAESMKEERIQKCLVDDGITQLLLYRFEGVTPVRCSDSVYNTTVEDLEAGLFAGAATTGDLQETRVVTQDESVSALADINAGLSESLYELAKITEIVFENVLGVNVTGPEFGGAWIDMRNRINATLTGIKERTVVVKSRQQINITDALLDFDEVIDGSLAESQEAIQNSTEALEELGGIIRETLAATQVFNQLQEEVLDAREAEFLASQAFFDRLVDVIKEEEDECGSGFFGAIFSFFTCGGFSTIIWTLVFVGLGVAVTYFITRKMMSNRGVSGDTGEIMKILQQQQMMSLLKSMAPPPAPEDDLAAAAASDAGASTPVPESSTVSESTSVSTSTTSGQFLVDGGKWLESVPLLNT
jgi:hypothetical protein